MTSGRSSRPSARSGSGSARTTSAQKGFTDAEGLDYPLLSDSDGAVASAYGVRRKYITPVKRATFVIGADGMVRDVITSELNFTVHADKALESLRGG